jgi:hypothetical protein
VYSFTYLSSFCWMQSVSLFFFLSGPDRCITIFLLAQSGCVEVFPKKWLVFKHYFWIVLHLSLKWWNWIPSLTSSLRSLSAEVCTQRVVVSDWGKESGRSLGKNRRRQMIWTRSRRACYHNQNPQEFKAASFPVFCWSQSNLHYVWKSPGRQCFTSLCVIFAS